jgi:hypothetical protein
LRIEKRRIAVGPRAATARIVLDQQGHSAAHDRRKNAEHEVGPAPSHGVDQQCGGGRHDQCADTDPAHRETGCKTAASDEPSLHGTQDRNIGKTDAKPDAEAVGRVDFRQAARQACDSKAEAGQDHAGYCEKPGAKAVGERSADEAQGEIQEPGHREDQRNRPARGGEIPLQRCDEGAERVGAAEPDKRNGKRAGNDEPAVKDAGTRL